MSGFPGSIRRAACRSDGWPMHLHNTLRALAGELARNGGDLDRLQAKRAAAVHRAAYYGERTGAAFQDEPDMLAAVMEQTGEDGLARRAIAEILVKHGGHRPAGMTPADAFKALLARGLLQRTPVVEDHLHACPIPSLRSWCAARTGNRLHRPAMTGNTELVAAGIAGGEYPNGRDVRGRTPLHIATEEGWPDIARLLLDAGADPSIRDNEGRTPAPGGRHARDQPGGGLQRPLDRRMGSGGRPASAGARGGRRLEGRTSDAARRRGRRNRGNRPSRHRGGPGRSGHEAGTGRAWR